VNRPSPSAVPDHAVRSWIAKLIVIAGCAMLAAYGIYAACIGDTVALTQAISGVQLLLGVVIGYYFGKR
jgi:hypothetical protein